MSRHKHLAHQYVQPYRPSKSEIKGAKKNCITNRKTQKKDS